MRMITHVVGVFGFLPNFFYISSYTFSEGLKKTYSEKVWSFAKPPSDPPGMVIFPEKKLTPIFLEVRPLLGETNFTLGPISKILFHCSLIMAFFPPGFGAFGLLSKQS